ncbi:nucleotidyltransferase family protein [Noviherbaspirillum saxi]|uniref:Nucleotidyltransferase family protein n=2 Tax=Noviherbaspirillum saxi TaxID=2320863 RepID=A0A3A3FVB6_9BURK|nr:nucleotidyltransferase family protein [Noviherbaspirillum saxi]
MRTIGILLAAGSGRRFDPSGEKDKLQQVLADGTTVAVAAARHLLAAMPSVTAVVRADNIQLATQLKDAGCDVTLCEAAVQGMAVSLVHALSETRESAGWVIALADMPFVQPATIQALAATLDAGAGIAVPTQNGRRGNPVAFSRIHLDELLSLRGDEGARRLLQRHPVIEIETSDPGIVRDIDTLEDLDASIRNGV